MIMECVKSECESFWDAKAYAVVTDNTKPAIKWTISELKKRGKNVYVIDLSKDPEPGSLKNVSELPAGLDRAVIGITKTDAGDLITSLYEKGINKIWLHWKTETEKAIDVCRGKGLECTTERCPMMYLGSGFSIHGMHRAIAKVMGKY
jgi:predicted CoA-binding protein